MQEISPRMLQQLAFINYIINDILTALAHYWAYQTEQKSLIIL